ncbi:PREDICTED: NXPE family member 3-like [Branchiostoma belcheri]|uniref:NXPE family member 3-like n=1 Tax=Branchiostoma belcheri TaxID=7741 RepID=A0A6P4ZMU8_BRABE|nr:PREDICTED: NXPE family member 3-like [Branchiostoma belcheri]
MAEPQRGNIRRYCIRVLVGILVFGNVGLYYFLESFWNIEYIYANQLRFCVTSPTSTFRVGDELRVKISARDPQNMIANVGDFLRASIYTSTSSSSAFGDIKDHENGTYTVLFRLLWSGDVRINIQLISSRQTVDIIERTVLDFPADKIMFRRRYMTDGEEPVHVLCNVDPGVLRAESGVCNYSDPHAGARWFCEKAEIFSCDEDRGFHGIHMYKATGDMLEKGEEQRFRKALFYGEANAAKIPLSGSPAKVCVMEGVDPLANRAHCMPGHPNPPVSGFYHHGVWESLVCENRHFITRSEWEQCLTDKTLHFFGDSTIRQWYEELVKILDMVEVPIVGAIHNTGPLLAHDSENNITVKFRIHGPPLRSAWTATAHLKYVANAIDEIRGGPNDVVGISVCAHFTSYPVDVYRERLAAIRAALERLLHRSPDTIVVIKSANTRTGNELIGGNWLLHKLDLMMREIFAGMKVVFLDAWEMTSAHWSEDNIHPSSEVVKQELEFLCSFICPL